MERRTIINMFVSDCLDHLDDKTRIYERKFKVIQFAWQTENQDGVFLLKRFKNDTYKLVFYASKSFINKQHRLFSTKTKYSYSLSEDEYNSLLDFYLYGYNNNLQKIASKRKAEEPKSSMFDYHPIYGLFILLVTLIIIILFY